MVQFLPRSHTLPASATLLSSVLLRSLSSSLLPRLFWLLLLRPIPSASSQTSALAPRVKSGQRMVTLCARGPGVCAGVPRETLIASNMGFRRVSRNWRGLLGGRCERVDGSDVSGLRVMLGMWFSASSLIL